MSIGKKLLFWITVTAVMSAALAACLYVVKYLLDDSFLRDCIVFCLQIIYYIITYNMVMFNCKWLNKLVGLQKNGK